MGSTINTDLLAQNGIVGFDANAYLKGTQPRFVGKPSTDSGLPPMDEDIGTANLNLGLYGNGYGMGMGMPYGGPSYGITPGQQLIGGPTKDAFVHNNPSSAPNEHSPLGINWAKVATGGILGGIAVLGAVKIKSLFTSKDKDKKATPEKTEATKPETTEAAKPETTEAQKAETTEAPKDSATVAEGAKPAEKEAEKAAETATKEASKVGVAKEKTVGFFKRGIEKMKGAPTWLKVGGLAVAGLCGGFTLFKALGPKHHEAEMGKQPLPGEGERYEQAPQTEG